MGVPVEDFEDGGHGVQLRGRGWHVGRGGVGGSGEVGVPDTKSAEVRGRLEKLLLIVSEVKSTHSRLGIIAIVHVCVLVSESHAIAIRGRSLSA